MAPVRIRRVRTGIRTVVRSNGQLAVQIMVMMKILIDVLVVTVVEVMVMVTVEVAIVESSDGDNSVGCVCACVRMETVVIKVDSGGCDGRGNDGSMIIKLI